MRVFSWMLTLCLLMTVSGGSAVGQQPGPNTDQAEASTETAEWHFGFEMFRMLLEEQDLQPVSVTRDILNSPDQSVIVIMGRVEDVVPPRTLEMFCERGGTVLLASDTQNSYGRIAEFQAAPVTTRQSQHQYQNFADCLTITDFNDSHPLMENVNSLVFNRSGWLEHPKWHIPDWDVVAQLPLDVSPAKSAGLPVIAEVRVSDRARGRLVIVSDQSLFTNGMLWHGDNAILAINVSKLLGDGERSRLLFIQDGKLVGSYQDSQALGSNSPNAVPPTPPHGDGLEQILDTLWDLDWATKIKMGDILARNLEESNLVNEFLANQPQGVSRPHYRRGVLFALTAAVLAFVIWKVTANGPLVHRPMPERTMKTAHALVTDRKVKAAEFGLAASLLSRELCRELTGSSDSADWQRLLTGKETPAAFPVRKKSQQKQLAVVLDLALNTRTVHISRRRFQFIGRSIQQLRQLHREQPQIS